MWLRWTKKGEKAISVCWAGDFPEDVRLRGLPAHTGAPWWLHRMRCDSGTSLIGVREATWCRAVLVKVKDA